ncbi:hypothetical protein ACFL1T_05105 [Chlamydiota bacterium]
MKKCMFGFILLILVTVIIGCGGGSNFWDSNFYVYNYSAHTLSIYMDGTLYFTLTPGTNNTILSVDPGFYFLEAVISSSHVLYATHEVDNAFDTDDHWYIY